MEVLTVIRMIGAILEAHPGQNTTAKLNSSISAGKRPTAPSCALLSLDQDLEIGKHGLRMRYFQVFMTITATKSSNLV